MAWWLAGGLFFMTGCSEPPTKEHDQAVASIAAAKQAGASAYATDDLAAAEDALKRYDGFVAQHEYKQALSAALTARDRGYDAAKVADTKQQALKAQIETLLASIEKDIKSADTVIAATPRAAAKRVDKLRQSRKAAQSALQEARTLSANGELTKAAKRLGDASAALKRDIAAQSPAPAKPKK